MKKYFFLSVVVVLALAVGYCHAAIPGKINYQGKLTNAQGQLIDGSYSIVFKLYDAATAGNQKWTETHSSVVVTNGLFNVMLGSTTDLASVFQANDALYLEIAVAGETLSPRQEMASVGYALHSAMDVPIGTILAWHKDLTGVPALPSGWLECNGQTVADAASPINGQVLPNLNSAPSGTEGGYFLRGKGASPTGTLQADTFQNHVHHVGSFGSCPWGSGQWLRSTGTGFAEGATNSDPASPSNYRTGIETRPINMQVVWIIRFK
ncbi:MAG: hypothetical protein NTZ78_03310 [Candidatus Aureabacteria bacterium]|nr:hypothetical protein [Candidatus Auribacterota bacterium]